MIPEKPPLDELVHHGVKGMKWGVRRDRSSPGVVTRGARRLATASTQKAINQHTRALNNKGLIGKAALVDKHTWGRSGRFEAYHNKRISELHRSQQRIAKGHLTARTLIFGPQYSKA